MELKGRLKAIAGMAGPCGTVCDIGTDHAYIPIYLVERGICKKAVAADVRKGPVLIAEENVRQAGLEGSIDVRLGYGLEPVREDEADCIVIAGMGGLLIQEILERGAEKARKAGKLILQPMNAVEALRKWLYENGYEIQDEKLSAEGSKLYNVICAVWTGKSGKQRELYYYIGKKLIDNKDELLEAYARKWVKHLEKVVGGLEKSNSDNTGAIQTLGRLKEEILEVMEAAAGSIRPE